MLLAAPAHADVPKDLYTFTSNVGVYGYLAAGIGLPLLTDGKLGKAHALRAADALFSTVIITEGLKGLVQEKRPDSNGHDSFPSGHASSAFAIATIQSQFHPRQAPYWFAGATLIGISRFGLHRHTVGDVLAGAALGYGTSRLELSSRRGLLLAPFVPPSGHGLGLLFTKGF